MIDTLKAQSLEAFEAEASAFRIALLRRGFADDGTSLRGVVVWRDDQQAPHSTHVEIQLSDRFPFAAPDVRLVGSNPEVTPTFHIERDGKLCLWGNDVAVDGAPWRDVGQFLQKISGWCSQTAARWPGDDDADLERYLEPRTDCVVLYDDSLVKTGPFYRTTKNELGVVTVNDALPWRPDPKRIRRNRARRKEKNLLAVLEVGPVDRPIRSWRDLQALAGRDISALGELVGEGGLQYLLVRYQRGARHAGIVLNVARNQQEAPLLTSCESADQSEATRTLRSGVAASTYTNKKVAIVGCGAVGSHIADLLFRSGVRKLTLIDPETLRPGNIIRHTADNACVGASKTSAVKARLAELGLDVREVVTDGDRIVDPQQALALAGAHDLIIDATADARATALIGWAAESTGSAAVSACVQRDGGIARVDRFPLQDGEHHLQSVPFTSDADSVQHEPGCGSPVSTTPPLSVIKTAALASQVALDELGRAQTLPATIIEVIVAQLDSPYAAIGMITS